jgi:MFS family permease
MTTDSIALPRLAPDARRAALLLIFAAFGLLGFSFGVWQVALPDLKAALQLSAGALGAALTAGFVAGFPMMVLGGRLAERRGARVPITLTAALVAVAFAGYTLLNQAWLIVPLLVFMYGGSGGLDVSMNAAAMAYEQITGRRVMAYLHAAFSGLAALGALLSGFLIYMGVPYRLLYLGVALSLGIFVAVVWRSAALPGPAARAAQAEAAPPRTPPYRLPAVIVLAAVAGLSFFSESTLENWSAIYLRTALGLPAVVGAAGPATFHTAMLLGRLGSGRILALLGRRNLLVAAGLVAAGGMALALATTLPPVILLGLLAAGLALSSVVPVAFSLAGDQAPERSGTVSAFVTTAGYGTASTSPALIGGLSELVGLRLALGVIILTGSVIAFLGTRVKSGTERSS